MGRLANAGPPRASFRFRFYDTMTALNTAPDPASTTKRPVLSFKTPDEIMAAEFPADHFFFENCLWGRGLPLGIIGPPGIGKSRLVLQLVVSAVCQ